MTHELEQGQPGEVQFTATAQAVLSHAREEAIRLNHHYLGTEHLLLGVLRLPETAAARTILNQMGVSIDEARNAVEYIIGGGDLRPVQAGEELGLTPRAKTAIELAAEEQRRLEAIYIPNYPQAGLVDSSHILLGLVREGGGIACGVLESMGVYLNKLTQVIEDLYLAKRNPLEDQRNRDAEARCASANQLVNIVRNIFTDRSLGWNDLLRFGAVVEQAATEATQRE